MTVVARSILSVALLASLGWAAEPPAVISESTPGNPTGDAAAPARPVRTAQELEQLLAPIALHPDALIALILPAATNPTDVVLAARRLARNRSPNGLDNEPWDDSVRALARYPELIKWMDDNLDWTRRMGAAFAEQPADVMNAVQRLRARARAAGTLRDSPQQQVVVQDETIRIVPARRDVIYVPRYDPDAVYYSSSVIGSGGYITYGSAWPAGHWLAYDWDWPRQTLWIVPSPHRSHDWRSWPDWRYRHFPHDRWHHRGDRWQVWRPHPHHPGGWDRPREGHPPHEPPHHRPPVVTRPRPSYDPSDGDEPTFRRPPQDGRDRDHEWDRRRRPGHDYGREPGSGHGVPRPGELPGGPDLRPGELPGGPTPSPATPVGPTFGPSPALPSGEPPRIVSPNGRRLPQRGGGEEFRPGPDYPRSPTGRPLPAQPRPPVSGAVMPSAHPSTATLSTVPAPEPVRPVFRARPDEGTRTPRMDRGEGLRAPREDRGSGRPGPQPLED